jgi:hypothetical protein
MNTTLQAHVWSEYRVPTIIVFGTGVSASTKTTLRNMFSIHSNDPHDAMLYRFVRVTSLGFNSIDDVRDDESIVDLMCIFTSAHQSHSD